MQEGSTVTATEPRERLVVVREGTPLLQHGVMDRREEERGLSLVRRCHLEIGEQSRVVGHSESQALVEGRNTSRLPLREVEKHLTEIDSLVRFAHNQPWRAR